MKYATFDEYQEAKNEVLSGVKFTESSTVENGAVRKQYGTIENGTFYEVNDGGIVEFWSDKHPNSRYYDGRTKDDIISSLKEKLSVAESEKEKAIQKVTEASVCRYTATEYQGRVFNIYNESKDPYPNQARQAPAHINIESDVIELSEATYMGGDLYIIPMQVYWTETPALLKVVFLIGCGGSGLFYSPALGNTFAEITNNNIRTAYMTFDKKLYYHSGACDCKGVYDLSPQEWRFRD